MKIIQLDNIRYEDNENVILDGITIDINKGDCISIIGESGSGKSTFIDKISNDKYENEVKDTVSKGLPFNSSKFIVFPSSLIP